MNKKVVINIHLKKKKKLTPQKEKKKPTPPPKKPWQFEGKRSNKGIAAKIVLKSKKQKNIKK